ncbi:helix-turn-helix domain-containing protein [Sinisalibacter lacisalsi]|uniref:Transcriptional regulator n=1 Tax=Sinisalibacter lacisalsi TaxID=1526570 RepID=A0ABQ1QH53_9RHOB|nr:helix-turn-helix domain-containing protein [Sinisalibacter lacisalsi]GGD25955.1 transcriptional regulator [Sinisalibacter lacisalsi]
MKAIESFNLFGESADLPDVVHCETIAARSVRHDWEFTPHRHARLHQVLLIAKGGGRGTFDGETLALAGGHLANVPIGCVHAYSFTPGTEGWVVTIPAEVLDEGLAEGEGLRPLLARPCVIDGTEEIETTIKAIFAAFEARRFARAHELRARVALLAGLVARAIAGAAPASIPAETTLQNRFEALVESHYAAHWPVAAYATRLGVTPTHLSRVMRAATGRPASATIQERIIREARRNLAYSNLSIAQVAYALGYDDPAHFSRVFRRATGLSPRQFRKRTEAAG